MLPLPRKRPPAVRFATAWCLVARLAAAALAAALVLGEARGASAGVEHPAGEEEFDEYVVKAAFLYNLIGYTTWPAEAFEDEHAPIRLTILGQDPFGDDLDVVFRGKRLHGRTVVITRARAVPEAIDAHVVFCASLDAGERAAVLERCGGRPVLVIGETPGFAEDGAAVNLRLEHRKLRFEVNTGELKRSGLSMSSQVLKLAKIVKTRKKK